MDEELRRNRRKYFSTFDAEDAARYIAALERAMGILPPAHAYEIDNILTASTSHITREESEWIQQHAERLPGLKFSNDYGWIFGLRYDELFDSDLLSYPANLANLIRLARSLDCEYLRLDADGPEYDDLPTWEW